MNIRSKRSSPLNRLVTSRLCKAYRGGLEKRSLFYTFVSLLITASLLACQTTIIDPKSGAANHYGYPDIQYKVSLGVTYISEIRNRIFVPQKHNGAAIVFLPSCTGIRSFTVEDVKNWVQFILNSGYAAAIPHYGTAPRPDTRPFNCGAQKHLTDMRLVKDVYDASLALSKVAGVDRNKIFVIGTSLGAQIGVDAINEYNAQKANENNWGPIPRGVVALYGGCSYPSRTYLTSDVVSPVLWMMGTVDKYFMQGCSTLTFGAIKRKHPKSELINYENAGHCWDCQQLNGYVNEREKQTYLHNPDITRKSRVATLRFLRKFD